jgi:hypothetical protein
MIKNWCLAFVLTLPISALAGVEFQRKLERVEMLEGLSQSAAFNIESYRRELDYERLQLPLEQRIQSEVDLLKLKIRNQIMLAFDAALEKHQDAETARQEVAQAIERDLGLMAPEFQTEISQFATLTLEGLVAGISIDLPLSTMEQAMGQDIQDRMDFLNFAIMAGDPETTVSYVDAEKSHYNTKRELLGSLGSTARNARFVLSSHQPIRIGESWTVDQKVSLRVKTEFLGVAVEAGPTISFVTNFGTELVILAEGHSAAITPQGTFDHWLRDGKGQVLVKDGQRQKRYLGFNCDAKLAFRTNYTGSGGFSFMGVGANVSSSKQYSSQVGLVSRRLAVPETVGTRVVDLEYLSRICNQDFLNLRLENSLTVMHTLNEMMKGVVNGLRFSHPKTNCSRDSHCNEWFRKNVISLLQKNNVPRCMLDKSENFLGCEARGLEGQRCPVKRNILQAGLIGNYLLSKTEFECDRGLVCVQTRTSLTGVTEARCLKATR